MRTKLTVHHKVFMPACLDVRELFATSKSAYYTNRINADQKVIFNVINNVLQMKQAISP